MLKFIKKVFFLGLTILSDFTNVNSLLNCISMKKLLILIVMNLYFILSLLKQVNVATVVIILMIQMQKYVFLML